MFHKELAGADLHAPTNYLVENNSGSDIPALTVVTIDGIGTNFPSVLPAIGSVNIYRGVTMAPILDGQTGYITGLGFMIGIDTSSWSIGTSLYCDAFGSLSITPSGPLVATVYKQDSVNGYLYIEGGMNSGGGGSGDVVGPGVSTDNAVTRWNGITGKLIQNSLAILQDGGGMESQGFLSIRGVTNLIKINPGESWIAPSIQLELGGSIELEADGEIIIV